MQKSYRAFYDTVWRNTYTPVTNTFLGVFALFFLGAYAKVPVYVWFECAVPHGFLRPWTIFTSSFLPEPEAWNTFINVYLIYAFGSSIEKSWGSRVYIFYCAVLSIVIAASFVPVAFLDGRAFHLAGMEEPVPRMVIGYTLFYTWCLLNSGESICGFIGPPIPVRYLRYLPLAVIFFDVRWGEPIVGICALAGCLLAYVWVQFDWSHVLEPVMHGLLRTRATRHRHSSRKPAPLRRPHLRMVPPSPPREVPPDDRDAKHAHGPVAWIKEQRERRKFERLMKDD